MKKIYSSTITMTHPVIKNHLVHGQALLPGLAYIDMLYQLVQDSMGLDYKNHCLKRLSISNPLIVGEDRPVKIKISFEKMSTFWKITVEGTETDKQGHPLQDKLYITAELHKGTIEFAERINAVAMKKAATQCVDIETVYDEARKQGLLHQGMIKATGNIYLTEPGCLIEIKINDAFRDNADLFLFHPTLIDGAAMAAGILRSTGKVQNEEDLFLPLYYESFCSIDPLRTNCFALVSSASMRMVNDILTFDMSFFNSEGSQVAQLKGITAKRVRFKWQINPELKEETVSSFIQGESVVTKTTPEPDLINIKESNIVSENIDNLLCEIFAKRLNRASSQININASFFDLGLQSSQLLSLLHDIENAVNLTLSPTLLFEYTTIAELVTCLTENYALNFNNHSAEAQGNQASQSAITEVSRTVLVSSVQDDIAIIGITGRFPEARNIQEFWNNLQDGKDCIIEVPKDRWDHSLYYDKNKDEPGKTCCNWGGFLEGVDNFDPLFFNIPPHEAATMDPMDRLFLETVWNLLESTGYTRESLYNQFQGRVGVYVGAMYHQYQFFDLDIIKKSALAFSSYNAIANRVSHFFNFQGPSLAVDTACSSSAIAIHIACEGLKKGECKLAIAGGVNLSIHPVKYLGLSQIRLLGSHINCRSFGDGDGYLPSEGVGAVLLKPLSQAIEDQDPILAVIKSTLTNHSGQTNGSVPNPNAQAQLIEDNFIKSGIDPRTISYVEAAANGLTLGDLIEVTALTKAFQKFTQDQQFCPIGSVKSNIGHAEAASGISQLAKVILQLQHQQLVPSIKAEPLNPNINFDNTPFYLQRELQEWKRPKLRIHGEEQEFPRRATISSFGAGGSYAHLIIEEYSPIQKEAINNHPIILPQIVVFSAKNLVRLKEVLQQILEFIESHPEISLKDLTYTLQVGREAMETRVAMIVNNRGELLWGLKECLESLQDNKKTKGSIPIFRSDLIADRSGSKNLYSVKSKENGLKVPLTENEPEKIALYWVQGGKISWESLYEKDRFQKLSLPTYPFEKQRYWIDIRPEPVLSSENHRPNDIIIDQVEMGSSSLNNNVITIISQLLGINPVEMEIDKPLQQYGFDSILLMQLLKKLQTEIDPSIDLVKLLQCRTIQDIMNIISPNNKEKSILYNKQTPVSNLESRNHFPELVRLNSSFQGQPVFWFHPGMGGIELYPPLAQKSRRPFYGIAARGWMTDRLPLKGIAAMAAYYIHMIQSVQPEGPYDIGGYSLGGMISYEVTRQLQELGQTVSTIVMLDSPSVWPDGALPRQTSILHGINFALLSSILQEPEKLTQTLINRQEVDLNVEDEVLFKQLVTLARKRGLTKTENQLQTMIESNVKLQHAYQLDTLSVTPLINPQEVNCYYFRAKRRLLWGELEPYFSAVEGPFLFDQVNYWEGFEQQISNFHLMDLDASNHMTVLSEPKVYESIFEFCERLYSEEGVSAEFLKSFKKKIKKIHGSKV